MYLIVFASCCLNFWNIGFGAEQSVYPDETFFDLYAFKILDYLRGNGIDYNLDPPVYSVCLAIAFSCYYVWGTITGMFHSLQDFIVHFSIHREDFIVIGRMVSAAFAVASIPFTYKTAERLFNKQVAIIAAAGLAISYPMVWFAHTIHHTTISVFISIVILYFAVRAYETGSWKHYLLCGVSIGIGIGVKLYPAMFALSLVALHFQRNPLFSGSSIRPGNFGKLFAAGFVAIPVMMVCYPWPFIENATWAESIKYSNVFFDGGNPITNFYYVVWGKSAYYSATSPEPFSFWSNSFRILSETTLLLAIISFVYLLFRYPSKWLVLFLPFVIFMLHHVIRGGLAMGSRQFYFLLPVMYIGIGVTLKDCYTQVLRLSGLTGKAGLTMQIAIVLVFFIQPVAWASTYLSLTGHPTTQQLGREWISQHLKANDLLLVNYAAPYVNIAGWYGDSMAIDNAASAARKAHRPPFTVKQLIELDYQKEVAQYKKQYANVYVALSDYNSTVYYNYDNCKLWGGHKYHYFTLRTAYFKEIYRHSEKVAEFLPREHQALGPVINIYKLR